MRFIRSLAPVVLLLVAACSSMKSDSGMGNSKVDIVHPELLLTQISSMPAAARHIEGGVPIRYELRVSNRSTETITLKQVMVQSMGSGAYTVDPTSRPFAVQILPDQYGTVQFWASGQTSDTITGANGPVTMRAVARFDSPVGQFEEIVIQQVNGLGVGTGN